MPNILREKLKSVLPSLGCFRSRGWNALHSINRHRLLVALGLMFIGPLLLIPALNAEMQGDVNLYQAVAGDLLSGTMPYRDRVLEYPPYAVPIFLLPRIFGSDNYLDGFMALALLADWGMKILLFGLGTRQTNSPRAFLPLLLYCAATPFLRYIFLQRYDIFPALICLASIWLFCWGRYLLCGLAIALGIGLKLYPVIFVPPLFVLSLRLAKGKQFALGLGGGLLPAIVLGLYLPWWRFAQFHAARGLQVESLYASLLWLGKLLGFNEAVWEWPKGYAEVHGPAAAAVMPWARAIFAGSLVISVALASLAARHVPFTPVEAQPESLGGRLSGRCQPDARSVSRISLPQLAQLMLLPLLAFVAFNLVLSPQYLIWLLPMAALSSLGRPWWIGFMILIATILTPIIYPSLHSDYDRGLDLFETIVLIMRNLILTAVWIGLLWETVSRGLLRRRLDL